MIQLSHNFATVQPEGERTVERMVEYYNLDMVITAAYRIKSQRGVEFADGSIPCVLDGCALNHVD